MHSFLLPHLGEYSDEHSLNSAAVRPMLGAATYTQGALSCTTTQKVAATKFLAKINRPKSLPLTPLLGALYFHVCGDPLNDIPAPTVIGDPPPIQDEIFQQCPLIIRQDVQVTEWLDGVTILAHAAGSKI